MILELATTRRGETCGKFIFANGMVKVKYVRENVARRIWCVRHRDVASVTGSM